MGEEEQRDAQADVDRAKITFVGNTEDVVVFGVLAGVPVKERHSFQLIY